MVVSFLVTVVSYLSYGNREYEDPILAKIFFVLEEVDFIKDLLFLYTVHHDLYVICILSLSLALPIVVNAFESNEIIFRDRFDGKPLIVHEKPLLLKTITTQ